MWFPHKKPIETVLLTFALCAVLAACGGGETPQAGGTANAAGDVGQDVFVMGRISRSFALIPTPLTPAIYYVDAVNGQDSWSGSRPDVTGAPGTDGPWQSLKAVNDRTFPAGSTILLKCGQTWREALAPQFSGLPNAPITIGSYPRDCTNKPAIDGSITLPPSAWTLHQGAIYKAQLPIDHLADRPLRNGLDGWYIWSQNTDATIVSASNCGTGAPPCLSATSGQTGTSILYSYRFALTASRSYALRFSSRAPAGVAYKVVVRRGSEPWDVVGLSQTLTGNGSWQNYTLPVQPATSLEIARIDFEIPAGRVTVAVDDVRLDVQHEPLRAMSMGNGVLVEAHHPNHGHDPTRPESAYLRAGADSAMNMPPGSSYLVTGADAVANYPLLSAARRIRLSSRPWHVDERVIVAFDGTRFTFDKPSTYPIVAQSGYLLLGSLSMLDSPGEWYFDDVSKMLYVWMPDGLAPGRRVSITVLGTGIDVQNQSSIVVDNLAIRKTGVGVTMAGSAGVTLSNLAIADTAAEGIDISNAKGGTIANNLLERTGRDAIARSQSVPLPQGMTVRNNSLVGSGVDVGPNGAMTVPAPSAASIQAGRQAIVSANSILRSSYHGIVVNEGSQVSGNVIQDACLQLDDCGGIYMFGANNNSIVASNFVSNLLGNASGRPENRTHTVGIYLDELSSGVTVQGNMVAGADYGIQLHDAAGNSVTSNTLYGNRRYQMWLQENSLGLSGTGNLNGNQVVGNSLIPSNGNPALFEISDFGSTSQFATYDRNSYSTLLNPYVARVATSANDLLMNFQTWQALSTAGIARNNDPTGRQVAQAGYTSFEVTGASLLENGDMSSGTTGWQTWSLLAPPPQTSVGMIGDMRWLRFIAGASSSLFFPGNFSVAAGQWYRLTFDMKTLVNNQRVVVGLARGGGGTNGYELLTDNGTQYVFGSPVWKRYTLMFKANKTVNRRDPVTGDYGARVNFQQIQPGQEVHLSKVELVPMRPVGTTLRLALLSNPGRSPTNVNCPDATALPSACSQYIKFSDGTKVAWPYTLPAISAVPIFTRDESLVDSDSDGIADIQDACPFTAIGEATNARGCGLSQ